MTEYVFLVIEREYVHSVHKTEKGAVQAMEELKRLQPYLHLLVTEYKVND